MSLGQDRMQKYVIFETKDSLQVGYSTQGEHLYCLSL